MGFSSWPNYLTPVHAFLGSTQVLFFGLFVCLLPSVCKLSMLSWSKLYKDWGIYFPLYLHVSPPSHSCKVFKCQPNFLYLCPFISQFTIGWPFILCSFPFGKSYHITLIGRCIFFHVFNMKQHAHHSVCHLSISYSTFKISLCNVKEFLDLIIKLMKS